MNRTTLRELTSQELCSPDQHIPLQSTLITMV